MTINVLFYNSYYRYREKRKQIKNLVDALNYQQAKTDLDETITEHNTKYGNIPKQRLDFNYGEKIIMEHTKRHLDQIVETGENHSFRDENGQIFTHIDKVKKSLDAIPKVDYTYHPG